MALKTEDFKIFAHQHTLFTSAQGLHSTSTSRLKRGCSKHTLCGSARNNCPARRVCAHCTHSGSLPCLQVLLNRRLRRQRLDDYAAGMCRDDEYARCWCHWRCPRLTTRQHNGLRFTPQHACATTKTITTYDKPGGPDSPFGCGCSKSRASISFNS